MARFRINDNREHYRVAVNDRQWQPMTRCNVSNNTTGVVIPRCSACQNDTDIDGTALAIRL